MRSQSSSSEDIYRKAEKANKRPVKLGDETIYDGYQSLRWKSGNQEIYMSSGHSPFTVKLFSPEESFDMPDEKPIPQKQPTRRLSVDSESSDTLDRSNKISVIRGRSPVHPSRTVQIVREENGRRRSSSPIHVHASYPQRRADSPRNNPTINSSSSSSSSEEELRLVHNKPMVLKPASRNTVVQKVKLTPLTDPCHVHLHHCPNHPSVMVTHVCVNCQKDLDSGNILVSAPTNMPPARMRRQSRSPCQHERRIKIQPVDPGYVEYSPRRRSSVRRSNSKTFIVPKSRSSQCCSRSCSPVRYVPPRSPVRQVRPCSPMKQVRPCSPMRQVRPCSPRRQVRQCSPMHSVGHFSPVRSLSPICHIRSVTPHRPVSPIRIRRPCTPEKKKESFMGVGEIYANRAFMKLVRNH